MYDRILRRSVVRENGCIVWTGCRIRKGGHGIIRVSRKKWLVHRLAWSIANGPIPAGMVVRHLCNNSSCVALDHLCVGTQADNVRDTARSDRLRRKLSVDAILSIRGDDRPLRDIAEDHNISEASVSMIRNRKTWAHIRDDGTFQ